MEGQKVKKTRTDIKKKLASQDKKKMETYRTSQKRETR